jgi:hypothetical protein
MLDEPTTLEKASWALIGGAAMGFISVDAALTEEEIGFLEELVDAGEAGRTITGLMSRAGLLRLVHLQYASEQSTSLDTALYRITDAGRDALRVLDATPALAPRAGCFGLESD